MTFPDACPSCNRIRLHGTIVHAPGCHAPTWPLPRTWQPGGARRRAALVAGLVVVALVVAAARPAGADEYATRATARTHPGCQAIHAAFIRQGAPVAVADRFAWRIAPRESGCVPQYVKNRTDWSYSVVGLNGRTAALRRGWQRLCGHDVRTWAGYDTDARCAMAAYRAMGWQPWQVSR